MAFAPTPPRQNAPSQLLSLSSLLIAAAGNSGGGNGAPGSVSITAPLATGSVGVALSLAGIVAPGATAVQAGLSVSATVAPTSWTNASVSGAGWTASLVPASAGTYYVWAQQTNTPSVRAVSGAIEISNASSGVGSVTFSSPPSMGTVGMALSLTGSVSPSGSAVEVGLSESATTAPSVWNSATVSAGSWSASLTPSTAGTYYIWAEQTSEPSVQAVTAAVFVAASSGGGSALSYSLIGGSGNGSLTGVTLTSGTTYTVDWTSKIAHGATDVRPGVTVSSLGAVAACTFWFDTSATNTTVPTSNYGNAGSLSNGQINFYANNTGYGTPTAVPAAPSTAGTYYGKYAMYDSAGELLGIFVTSAITIT
jgi:hypothetical protein